MPAKNLYLNDADFKKVGSLSELWGLDFKGTLKKLIGDAFTREFPAGKKESEQ